LRRLQAPQAAAGKAGKGSARSRARMVSFRDEDGRFRFRLFAADGSELLLSEPFDDPKELHRLGSQLGGLDLDALDEDPRGLALRVEDRILAYCPIDRLDDLRAIQADLSA